MVGFASAGKLLDTEDFDECENDFDCGWKATCFEGLCFKDAEEGLCEGVYCGYDEKCHYGICVVNGLDVAAEEDDINGNDIVIIKCENGDIDCPDTHECNEFSFCVPKGSMNPMVQGDDDEDETVFCVSHRDCFEAFKSTRFHCGQNGECISGPPKLPPTLRFN